MFDAKHYSFYLYSYKLDVYLNIIRGLSHIIILFTLQNVVFTIIAETFVSAIIVY